MAIKAENKRISITQTARDQELFDKIDQRRADELEPMTASEIYRSALMTAHYADWTQKPLEKMDTKSLALFVATFDEGVPGSGDAELQVRAMRLLKARIDADLAVWDSFAGVTHD